MMKRKTSTAALALLERVAADPALEPAHRRDLLRAKKELQRINRSGKPRKDDVFEIVRIVAGTLCDVLRIGE